VDFTREPIIETIITPRDGFRLIVRNSKQGSEEEFFVEAVEVVSFGRAHFYRSLEKPRPFLLPVGDYEITEVKENRAVLKNAQPLERTIKIGGGREGVLRKEVSEEEEALLPAALENEASKKRGNSEGETKRERRRNRRRRPSQEREEVVSHPVESSPTPKEVKVEAAEGAPLAPPFTHLIPPPTILISDTIHRYRDFQEPLSAIKAEEGIVEKKAVKDELFLVTNSNGDTTPLSYLDQKIEPL